MAALNFYDVLHRLIDGDRPRSEEEAERFHDAVHAHAEGLDHGGDYREQINARLREGKFQNDDDDELLAKASGGDRDALAEYRRRRRGAAPTTPQQSPEERYRDVSDDDLLARADAQNEPEALREFQRRRAVAPRPQAQTAAPDYEQHPVVQAAAGIAAGAARGPEEDPSSGERV
jgi:hypothetical protein